MEDENVYSKVFQACRDLDFPNLITILEDPKAKRRDVITAVIATGWYDAVLYLTQEMPYVFDFNELRAAIRADHQSGNVQINVLDCISAIADVAVLYDDEDEWKNCFAVAGDGPKFHRLMDVYTHWAGQSNVPIVLGAVLTAEQKNILEPKKVLPKEDGEEGSSAGAVKEEIFENPKPVKKKTSKPKEEVPEEEDDTGPSFVNDVLGNYFQT